MSTPSGREGLIAAATTTIGVGLVVLGSWVYESLFEEPPKRRRRPKTRKKRRKRRRSAA